MRPRRRDTGDLLELALAAFHAVHWHRFFAHRTTSGPRLVDLDDRSIDALDALPADLAEFVLAVEAGEVTEKGNLRSVLARRCAQR